MKGTSVAFTFLEYVLYLITNEYKYQASEDETKFVGKSDKPS